MENRPAYHKIRQPELFSLFQKIDIEQSIVSRFEQQTRLHPSSLAVKFRDHTVTYDDLNKSANRLARALLSVRQAHPKPIALLIEQGISLVTCIIAVLKAGFIYAPLDRRQPDQLLGKTLNNLNPSFVLTDCHNQHIAHSVTQDSCPVINIDKVNYGSSSDDLEQSIDPDSIANIYYTSGSTGSPKGVMNSHRNVLHNVMRYTNTLRFSTEDRMSLIQHSSFSGVVSTLFGALLNGATLCLFDLEKDGLTALSKWVLDEQISIFHSVPSIFRQFMKSCNCYPHLRIIRLEGDLATARDINFYREHFAKTCILVNGLGATECGLVRQYVIGHDTDILENDVPVGYQVEDMNVHVIDELGNDARAGHAGEIVIRSQFLALGYWRVMLESGV